MYAFYIINSVVLMFEYVLLNLWLIFIILAQFNVYYNKRNHFKI